MKVKLFAKGNPLGRKGQNQADLENEINAWLAQNPGIKVTNIIQSVQSSFGDTSLFISLWYEDGA